MNPRTYPLARVRPETGRTASVRVTHLKTLRGLFGNGLMKSLALNSMADRWSQLMKCSCSFPLRAGAASSRGNEKAEEAQTANSQEVATNSDQMLVMQSCVCIFIGDLEVYVVRLGDFQYLRV